MTSLRRIALTFMTVAVLSLVAPFGQAQNGGSDATGTIAVGDTLSGGQVHVIKEPGLYGLGRKVGNSEYAIASGMLIRIDPATLKVLSILRVQPEILD